MTSIVLPADLEAWARDEIGAGRAESIEGAIEGAVREHRQLIDAHRHLVSQAYASAARGELLDEAAVDVELDRWIAEDSATHR